MVEVRKRQVDRRESRTRSAEALITEEKSGRWYKNLNDVNVSNVFHKVGLLRSASSSAFTNRISISRISFWKLVDQMKIQKAI
jgi:hypothetical protein